MDKFQLFQNLVNMASVDGKFTDEEIGFLVSRAERWGIHNDDFESILVGIREEGATLDLPEAYADRKKLLEEMIRAMAADGEMAEVEKHLLATASAHMDFSTDEFLKILDNVIKRR